MLDNKEYTAELNEVVDLLLSNDKNVSSPFFERNHRADKNLYIIVSSTLGLCGSYNNNIFKVSDAQIKENDDAIILGEKGIAHYEGSQIKNIEGFNESYSINNKKLIRRISEFVLNEYEKGNYQEVHIIYSEYKNSLVFLAKDFLLLPLRFTKKEENSGYPPILEPSAKELMDKIVPFYIETALHSKLLESEVCEQGARSNAMENATNNAKDLLDELNIAFNKARQAAITQEITEIVAAAKAL